MTDMPNTPAHAKPRDHLWVLAVIAAFALFDVWGAWSQVGDKSGFRAGHTGTGWTLTVIVEAAAGYFLFAWFSAPGKRSRRCAMWSAFATLALSLIGQGASILAAKTQPPIWLAVFIRDLPVVTLALIAILIHMRRLDREDAAEAVQQDAKDARIAALQAERDVGIAALQAELDGERAALAPLREALAEAQRVAAEANAARETAERKLAAQKANGRRTKPANGTRRGKANGPAKAPANKVPETEVPDDFDARAEALELYLASPDISGKELGEKVGLTARWGQLRKAEFAKAVAGTGTSDERS